MFLYDTGYLYLFGRMDDSFLTDLLLIALCVSFAFSNVMAMEDSKGLWDLLSCTRLGKKTIIRCKWSICALSCTGITLLSWMFRFLTISEVYPMDQFLACIRDIPQYQSFPVDLPLLVFLLLALLGQVIAVLLVCASVLLISGWRKNYFQALFLTMLLLAAPLALAEMGLDIMKWFSVWPLYGWTGII